MAPGAGAPTPAVAPLGAGAAGGGGGGGVATIVACDDAGSSGDEACASSPLSKLSVGLFNLWRRFRLISKRRRNLSTRK